MTSIRTQMCNILFFYNVNERCLPRAMTLWFSMLYKHMKSVWVSVLRREVRTLDQSHTVVQIYTNIIFAVNKYQVPFFL